MCEGVGGVVFQFAIKDNHENLVCDGKLPKLLNTNLKSILYTG